MSERLQGLDITTLVQGGRGLGHHRGKAVFVPLTAPGDRVDCRVLREKSRYIEAELIEIVEPSPVRRDPPCPYFGDCGGCQWQHLPYREQLAWKASLYTDQLVRSKVAETSQILPIVSSPEEWHYRNRVQFKCHRTTEGMAIGFYRAGSHFVVDTADCLLVRPEIGRVLQLLREELPAAPRPDCIPQVDVACGDDGSVRIILHVLPQARKVMRSWLETFADHYQLNTCLQSGRKDTLETLRGDGQLSYTVDHPEIRLLCGPGGFVQVNSRQNRRMVAELITRLNLQGTEDVVDLFCGMGNFSLPLARRAAHVLGIEDYAPSIASARRNAFANRLHNSRFQVADAAAFGRYCGSSPDLIMLDPPRTGSPRAMREILRLQPQRIVYISCEPSTLTRDLKLLVHGGYAVAWSQPFDLFPQTGHIESLTLLVRTGAGG
ncbi:MAG: 23S rRNA (uracil(1939)-C(5))-methyltransferase RlmD [Desulfuromonadales bacterium]